MRGASVLQKTLDGGNPGTDSTMRIPSSVLIARDLD